MTGNDFPHSSVEQSDRVSNKDQAPARLAAKMPLRNWHRRTAASILHLAFHLLLLHFAWPYPHARASPMPPGPQQGIRQTEGADAGSLEKYSWPWLVKTGRTYIDNLDDPAFHPAQSPYKTEMDLEQSGWIAGMFQVPTGDDWSASLKEILVAFGLPARGDAYEKAEDYEQSESWRVRDDGNAGGNAEILWLGEPGAIIRLDTRSPIAEFRREGKLDKDVVKEEELRRIAPDLQVKRWSDVAFIDWRRFAERKKMSIKKLRVVVNYLIANDITENAIRHALGVEKGDRELPQGLRRFPPESDEAAGLMATPNGSGCYFLLATHRDDLGPLTIEEVAVYVDKALIMHMRVTLRQAGAKEKKGTSGTSGDQDAGAEASAKDKDKAKAKDKTKAETEADEAPDSKRRRLGPA